MTKDALIAAFPEVICSFKSVSNHDGHIVGVEAQYLKDGTLVRCSHAIRLAMGKEHHPVDYRPMAQYLNNVLVKEGVRKAA